VLIDRIGLNCAVCHSSTVKITENMDPKKIYADVGLEPAIEGDRVVILGMPAATMDLKGYLWFLMRCGTDNRFTANNVLAYIDTKTHLSPLERLFYSEAVPRVRDALIIQQARLAVLDQEPEAGPGRVDTFNPYKALQFRFPPDGTVGNADLPSIWN